jgi:hypothetical protein
MIGRCRFPLPLAILAPISLALAGLTVTSCGYRVGGKADLVPKSIQTIAIPAFNSQSNRYPLADQLANQIGREFLARTRFTVSSDPATADAVLNGTVSNIFAYSAVADPTSGKSTSILIQATLNIRLVERATGRVLYTNPGMSVKTYYAIATDPHQTFDETGPAYQRLAEQVARDVVSAVVESF